MLYEINVGGVDATYTKDLHGGVKAMCPKGILSLDLARLREMSAHVNI